MKSWWRAIPMPLRLSGVAVAMFGFAFGSVPLYDLICDITGIDGRGNLTVIEDVVFVPGDRELDVTYMSTTYGTLGVEAMPLRPREDVVVGVAHRSDWSFENHETTPVVTRAIPQFVPAEAARWVKKIECFCFNEITLQPGEVLEAAMVMTIDPQIPKRIGAITVAYTMFETPESEDRRTAAATVQIGHPR